MEVRFSNTQKSFSWLIKKHDLSLKKNFSRRVEKPREEALFGVILKLLLLLLFVFRCFCLALEAACPCCSDGSGSDFPAIEQVGYFIFCRPLTEVG